MLEEGMASIEESAAFIRGYQAPAATSPALKPQTCRAAS
jgi:hypothetical protein